MTKKNLLGLTIEELKAFITELGEAPFRSRQLFKWINRGVTDFEEMSDFSKTLRTKLSENAYIGGVDIIKAQKDKSDGTHKFLYELEDGNAVEGVFMKYKYGNSLCVSSQVGCKMGCKFCASALDGFVRNLTAGEILGQVMAAEKYTGEDINHIVVMGMGEPLDNYENLLKFIQLLSGEGGLHISQRNITISTCGIVPKIKSLAEEQLQITLALSLHASNQEKRLELMPIANAYHIQEVIKSCQYYFEKTGRRITFEYALVGGVNDTQEDVKELAELLKGINCHMNLIPINPIKERDYVQSKELVVQKFKNNLEKYGIHVTIRREMGRDIDGACGQLRRKVEEKR